MAQSPVRRPVSQVEDFKARFGVVQGQRNPEFRNFDQPSQGSSGFSSRQMIAAIALAMIAGMSGAAVFWFAQDISGQGKTPQQTVASQQQASDKDPPAATAQTLVVAQSAQNSSVQKSSEAESPVLPSGGAIESSTTAASQPVEKVIAPALPAENASPSASLKFEAATEVAARPLENESPAAPQAAIGAQTIGEATETALPAAPLENNISAVPEAETAASPVQEVVAEPAAAAPQETALVSDPPAEAAPEQQVALATTPAPAPAPAETPPAADAVPAIAPGQVWSDCNGCPELVAIVVPKDAAGGIRIAAQNEVPGVQPFALGRFEITFDDWARCVAAAGCAEMPSDAGFGSGNRPVINVSHQMIAEQYLPWLSKMSGKEYRLPTSQEWDIAEAGGEAALGRVTPAWTAELLCGSSNFATGGQLSCNDPFPQSAPIGSYQANVIGLHDMRGNVWEWVSDCWTPGFNYKAKPSERDCRKHLVRGGGWSSQPSLAALAPKGFEDEARVSRTIGFRVARSLP